MSHILYHFAIKYFWIKPFFEDLRPCSRCKCQVHGVACGGLNRLEGESVKPLEVRR